MINKIINIKKYAKISCFVFCIFISSFIYAETQNTEKLYSISVKNTNDLTLVETVKEQDNQIKKLTIIQSKQYAIVDYDKYTVMMNIVSARITTLLYKTNSMIPEIDIIHTDNCSISFIKESTISYNNQECIASVLVDKENLKVLNKGKMIRN